MGHVLTFSDQLDESPFLLSALRLIGVNSVAKFSNTMAEQREKENGQEHISTSFQQFFIISSLHYLQIPTKQCTHLENLIYAMYR